MEEPDGLVAVLARGERGDLHGVLALRSERLSAGGQDRQPRRGGEQFGDELPAGVDDPLAAVEDEQQTAVGEPFAERCHRPAGAVVQQPDTVADRRGEQLVVIQVGEVGPPHAVRVPVPDALGGLQGQPALADPAAPAESDQPVILKCPVDAVQFAVAADETGRHDGEVAHHAGHPASPGPAASVHSEKQSKTADNVSCPIGSRHKRKAGSPVVRPLGPAPPVPRADPVRPGRGRRP